MTEEWRAVLNGTYEVSSEGRVRRATPGRRTAVGRLLTPIALRVGYLAVRPVVDGRNVQMYVHRLVASAFLGECPPGGTVNHKDGVKTNNRADNLEYVTHAENMAHAASTGLLATGERHPAATLTDEQVRALRADRAAGLSYAALSRRYGVAISHVWQIVQGHARRTA